MYADRTALAQILQSPEQCRQLSRWSPWRGGHHGGAPPEHTTFHVQDNGRGIAARIAKVFEPFRRVGKQDVPGEGMGLAYVQPWCAAMGHYLLPLDARGRDDVYLHDCAGSRTRETHA